MVVPEKDTSKEKLNSTDDSVGKNGAEADTSGKDDDLVMVDACGVVDDSEEPEEVIEAIKIDPGNKCIKWNLSRGIACKPTKDKPCKFKHVCLLCAGNHVYPKCEHYVDAPLDFVRTSKDSSRSTEDTPKKKVTPPPEKPKPKMPELISPHFSVAFDEIAKSRTKRKVTVTKCAIGELWQPAMIPIMAYAHNVSFNGTFHRLDEEHPYDHLLAGTITIHFMSSNAAHAFVEVLRKSEYSTGFSFEIDGKREAIKRSVPSEFMATKDEKSSDEKETANESKEDGEEEGGTKEKEKKVEEDEKKEEEAKKKEDEKVDETGKAVKTNDLEKETSEEKTEESEKDDSMSQEKSSDAEQHSATSDQAAAADASKMEDGNVSAGGIGGVDATATTIPEEWKVEPEHRDFGYLPGEGYGCGMMVRTSEIFLHHNPRVRCLEPEPVATIKQRDIGGDRDRRDRMLFLGDLPKDIDGADLQIMFPSATRYDICLDNDRKPTGRAYLEFRDKREVSRILNEHLDETPNIWEEEPFEVLNDEGKVEMKNPEPHYITIHPLKMTESGADYLKRVRVHRGLAEDTGGSGYKRVHSTEDTPRSRDSKRSRDSDRFSRPRNTRGHGYRGNYNRGGRGHRGSGGGGGSYPYRSGGGARSGGGYGSRPSEVSDLSVADVHRLLVEQEKRLMNLQSSRQATSSFAGTGFAGTPGTSFGTSFTSPRYGRR